MFGFHGAVLLLSSAATVIYYNRSLLICQQLFLFFSISFQETESCFFQRLMILSQIRSNVNHFLEEKNHLENRAEKEGFEPSRRFPDLHP